ncbi:phosphopentomutase, partial [SCandidatus Aminicenantes bacterium Aminicenantia_JdfR_composite]|nr:phosphopentomutase [SCandidatus Aminicenantes bacterium Aminicenantia_JdfR_composite]
MPFNRIIVFVLDSLGIGELPDASLYGDEGSNTLGNILREYPLKIPNLSSLGIGFLDSSLNKLRVKNPVGCYGKMAEKSPGKDTTSGHWELMGIILKKPFPVYPNGFPDEIIEEFSKRIGRRILGNFPASGTEIIKLLGRKHLETGYPIVYTSADSVFQIAAHEEVIPLDELYWMCEEARKILVGEHSVCRVIARPFKGDYPNFIRDNKRRRDFSIPPPEPTLLDLLKNRGMEVIGIGKIGDIFAERGLTRIIPTKNNEDGIKKTIELIDEENKGLILVNLNDFDTLYGHRNNVEGYAHALEYFDSCVPRIISKLKKDDLLIFTADHGC